MVQDVAGRPEPKDQKELIESGRFAMRFTVIESLLASDAAQAQISREGKKQFVAAVIHSLDERQAYDAKAKKPLHGQGTWKWSAMLIAVLGICAAVGSIGCKGGRSSTHESPAVPRLVAPVTERDARLADNTKIIEDDFPLRNQGSAPLEIERVISSGRCTVPELSDRTIQPGAHAQGGRGGTDAPQSGIGGVPPVCQTISR